MKRLLLILMAIVAGFAVSGQLPELIYYQFEDGSTSATNYAQTPVGTNPAPITGTLTTSSGGFLSSNALSGTGASSTGNTLNTGWNTTINGSFTIAFWTSGVPTSTTLYYIFGDAGASSFRCFTNGVAGANNWMIRGAGLPDLAVTGAATSASNMVHVVYDATAGTYTSYVDGVQNTQVTVTAVPNVTGTGLTIGGYTSSSGLSGLLDEFRWYNRALTSAEIQSTYNVDLNVAGNCANAFTGFLIDSITANAAKIDWTPGTGNTSFYLEYGPTGFTPGTAAGTKITGTYPGSQPPVILTGLSPITSYDVYFGEICNSGADSVYFPSPLALTTPSLCPPPISVSVLSTTTNTADVSINSPFSTFDVEWGPVGFSQGTGCFATLNATAGVITLNNASAPGCLNPLQPNASYHFYIRSNCTAAGNGASVWDGPYQFTTACTAFTAPYYNGFDNDSLDVPPICWEGYATGTSALVEVEDFTGTAAPFSGSKALYLYSGSSSTTGGDTLVAISPQFSDLTANDKRLRFMANSDGPASQLIVGTISSPLPTATFTPMDTIAFQVADTYEEVIVNFNAANGYNGTDEYIVLAHSLGSTFQYVRIDEFNYELIPACPGPSSTSLGVANTTGNTADVYWGSTGQGDYTRIEWGLPGFTPGPGGSNFAFVPGTTDTFTITGLIPQTTYEFYIQDTCTVGGSGIYQGPVSFTTACATIMAPYSEDFENHTLGWFQGVDNCWTLEHTVVKTSATSGFGWDLRNTPQTSSGTTTGAGLDNTLAPNTGGKFFNADVSYGTTGNTSMLISPVVDVSGLTNPALEYHIHRYGTLMGDFYVDIHDGTQWVNGVHAYTNLSGIQSSQADAYQDTLIDLSPYVATNGTVRARFRVVSNGCCAGDNSLDDIGFIEGPTCPDPINLHVTGLTDTEANLKWFDDPSAVGYQVWYGPQGFYQGTQTVGGTKVVVTDSLALSALTQNTCYEFAVRKICSPGDTSQWVGATGFCTYCTNQLSGTYTIGGPAGPTNFPTLDSAVSVLNSCGVSGPTVFNMSGGTHNSQYFIEAPGASAVNTITFNGSAAGDSIIGSGGAIELNGADYITFNNLFIKSNTGFTVWMHDDAHHINFDNCQIESDRSTTSSLNSVMVASASPTSQSSAGLNAHHVSVTNSTIAGGYYGITIYNVSSTSHVNGLQVENCEFEDIYYYGVRSYYNDSVQIINNHFEPFRGTSGYGMYLYYNDAVEVTGNEVEWVGTYSLYSYYTNDGSTGGISTIANNLLNSSGTYGVYMYSNNNLDFFHNTVNGGTHGMYLGGSTLSNFSNLDFRNNIFTANGTGRALWIATSPLSGFVLDYNLYHNYVGTELAYHNATAYTTLSAWQTAEPSFNVNSVAGDPVYISPSDNLRVLGSVPHDVGDNSVGITVDVDGDPRPGPGSTTVDIGADEYTPLVGDLAFISGDFIKGFCLSTNDSIVLGIHNLIGSTVDFSVDALTITYDVTGPVNTSGTIVVNTGTLNPQDTLVVYQGGIDLSVPGVYTLNAYIDSNAINVMALNDTLNPSVDITVHPEFEANPKTVILPSANDSTEICIESSFFSGGTAFFISEVCHFKTTSGAPVGGWPAYLSADDYIEITGVPGSDLGGITLEQWSTTALQNTHTFPSGTLLGPNGTAIIAVGQATSSSPSPSDYYYHGNISTTYSSGGNNGRILKDANGNIIDAVGVGSTYSFPASSGVTAADWSGTSGSHSGMSGVRLTGPDLNNASNWVLSSVTPQDPNIVNAGVIVPNPAGAAGFTWSHNGVVIDTMACITVGPYTSSGVYQYVANYTNSCGTFADTVTVIVPSCSAPSTIGGSALSASSVEVTWDSTGTGALNFDVEYGPAGFSIGSGTRVTATGISATVTGLPANLCQDFYVRASCGPNDSSAWIGSVNICPDVSLCDDLDAYAAGGPISNQSALFIPWQGAGGDEQVSTTYSNSSPNSLRIHDGGTAGFVDLVAYFDTISSGAWNITFDMYIPSGKAGYFNIQQNHALNGVGNLWGGEIYFLSSGTAEVQYSTGTVIAGTFSYTHGQWFTMNTVIDLGNDTVWFEMNNASTGVGYDYSLANIGAPLQFNGINFYSGVQGTDQADYYMDNFCITPYVPTGCPAPSGVATIDIGCDSAEVSWSSSSGNNSTILEYGPTGFTPGSGTLVPFVNSPQIISGLTPGTTYDVYLADTCGTTDTSSITGPITFSTLTGPLPVASFTASVTGFDVSFDASASTNGTTYSWDFGDGNNGSGAITNHTYATGGSQTVTLTVANSCGTDDTIITVASIGIIENELDQSLVVYPNPSSGDVSISFENAGNDDVIIRVLDLSGKQVMVTHSRAAGNTFEERIHIGNLADGVYMLEISSGSMKANRRLIKQ